MSNRYTGGALLRFLPFWIFLIFFKFGGALHYSVISPLGEKVLPLSVVGLIIGLSSIIQLILDVPAGHMLDRYGYRRFLKITTFIFLFAALAFVFDFTKTSYIISIAVSTFGWLFFGPAVNAYILSHAPRENAGRFISLRDVFGSVGVVMSSAILPFVIFLTPQYLGYLLFAIFFVAFIMVFFCPKDHERVGDGVVIHSGVHSDHKIETHHHYVKRRFLGEAIEAIGRLNPASGMLFLVNMTGSIFYAVIWFVVPLVIVHEVDGRFLSLGLGIFDFSVVILGFILGTLADKLNKRTLIFFGLLLFSLSAMLIGFDWGWLFLLFGFLATTGDEMSSISLWSWLHSLDKEHANDGAVAGALNLSTDLGWAIGPIAAGLLYGLIGPSWTILLSALPIFVTWIAYQAVIRSQPHKSLSLFQIPAKPHKARHRT